MAVIIPSIKNSYDDAYPLIQSHFFCSSYDPQKHFVWETIFGDDGTTIDQDKTEIEKKKAWIECFKHHLEYLQVLPYDSDSNINTQWITFYSVEYSFIDTADRCKVYLTLYELPNHDTNNQIKGIDTYSNISERTIPEFKLENFDALVAAYESLQNLSNYVNATSINRTYYNHAAYVKIVKPSYLNPKEFKEYLSKINQRYGFKLPIDTINTTKENYFRFNKFTNIWEPVTIVLENGNLIEAIPVGGD